MPVNEIDWSTTEQELAQAAFNRAYKREIQALIDAVNKRAGTITDLNDMWHLHDFLSAKRHEVDGKYDYRYPVLIFVFARLVKEGWLHLNELEGLAADKLAKVNALTQM